MVKSSGYTFVTPRERALMRRWKRAGKSLSEIMALIGRGKLTVQRNLKTTPCKNGRKTVITPAAYRKLASALRRLQKQAKTQREVTIAMVIKTAGIVASEKLALQAFRRRGISFRPIPVHPILSADDVKARKRWADKYKHRRPQTWVKNPAAIIDNKLFPLFRDRVGRAEAARRLVRGAYRQRGAQPQTWLAKNKASMKFPVKGMQVTAAIIKGRIRMWHYVDGNWSGEAAKTM